MENLILDSTTEQLDSKLILIQLVKEYAVIYDKSSPDYKDRKKNKKLGRRLLREFPLSQKLMWKVCKTLLKN